MSPRCEPTDAQCLALACPEGGTPYRIREVVDGGGELGDVVRFGGDVCVQPDEQVITEAQIEQSAQRFFAEVVPLSSAPLVQPEGQTLVNLPTIFAAQGQTEAFSRSFTAFGVLPIRLDVRPVEWTWSWRGGSVSSTTPGRGYDGTDPAEAPGRYVTHTFRSTDRHQVTVTTTWRATYTVAGLGTQPVPGSVSPTSAPVDLQVRQALSEINR